MNIDAHGNSMHGRKVLLVDDEKMVLEVGKAILQRMGNEVITAASGEEALDQFDQHRESIGCVVLDLTMPGMDGKATFKRLRSGLAVDQITGQFGDMPPSSVIQKPYQVADLSAKIECILNSSS